MFVIWEGLSHSHCTVTLSLTATPTATLIMLLGELYSKPRGEKRNLGKVQLQLIEEVSMKWINRPSVTEIEEVSMKWSDRQIAKKMEMPLKWITFFKNFGQVLECVI